MIKILCDKCGKEAERVGYSVEIHSLHNASPMYLSDSGTPHITDDNSYISFTLCQKCYIEIGLPNIHLSARKDEIQWRGVQK